MSKKLKIAIPRAYQDSLRVGTCSWKFDSWKGLVYDKDKKYRAHDYLADYAGHFNTVEIDQWFWSLFPGGVKLPDEKTVRSYNESVPDDFVFTIKAPNSITLTHFYKKQPKKYIKYANQPNEHFLEHDLLERFLETLSPMRSKLGPIMFQFEYLNKKKMPSKREFLDRFGEFIAMAPAGFQYGLESRNPNYLSSEFFEALKQMGAGYVYLEGYYMPPIAEVFEKYRPHTAGFCVIRLHGGDRLEMEQMTGESWDRVAAPKPAGLKAAARIVRENAAKKVLTYVNLNNHYEGSAPISAQSFLTELKKK